MSDYQYPQFEQGLSDQASKDFNWYKDWYAKQNAPTPVTNTPSSAPGFQGAAQNANDYAQGVRGTGDTGSLDFGALARGLNRKATLNSRTTDIGSLMSDLNQNWERGNKYAADAMNKTQGIGQAVQGFEGQAPLQAFGNSLKTQDYIKSMWDAYHAGQPSFGGGVAGALGGFAGSLIGGGGKPKSVGAPQIPGISPNGMPSYDQQGLDWMGYYGIPGAPPQGGY